MPARISDKMGIQEGASLLIINGPADSVSAIQLPRVTIAVSPRGEYDHILLFVKTQAVLDTQFAKLKTHLATNGKIWVAWPKGGKLGTDLNIREVIRIGYTHNLVESVNLRVDDTWTALKFTHPKPGKTYNNSYGQLPI